SQLLPGMELNLKLVQIIPPVPGTTTPMPVTILQNAGNLTIAAQVTSQSMNGQMIVQTDQGNILLQAGGKFAAGTTLVFELVQNTAHTGAALPLPEVVKNNAMPKLEQAMLLMNQIDNENFRALVNAMPKLNGQFPVTTLFFLQALRTGDVRNWIGDRSLQALR